MRAWILKMIKTVIGTDRSQGPKESKWRPDEHALNLLDRQTKVHQELDALGVYVYNDASEHYNKDKSTNFGV